MTKILLLHGESDTFFARDMLDKYSIKELVKMAEDAMSKGTVCDFYDPEYPDYWIGSLIIREFKEVDPEFIQFLDSYELLIDYDMAKHRDFIILTEENMS